jgi:hypothetical protein
MPALARYPKNPRYLQDPAGYPVYFCGFSSAELFHRTDLDTRTLLLNLAETGINCIHLPLDMQDRDPALWISPFKRGKGNNRTPKGFRKFDLDALNPAYRERLTGFVKSARQNLLYVLVGLFVAPFDLTPEEAWAGSLWNPVNNVNGEALGDRLAGEAGPRAMFEAFTDPGSDAKAYLERVQRDWLTDILAPLLDFPNVFCHVGGEPFAPPEWAQQFTREAAESEMPTVMDAAYANHPASVNPSGYVVRQEMHAALHDVNRSLLIREMPLPVELGPSAIRRAAWTAFFHEAQPFFYLNPDDSTDASLTHFPAAELHAASSIRRFMKERRVRYWTMKNEAALTDGKCCLARRDDRYLVYLPMGGNVTLNLSDSQGTFTLAWWSVKDEYAMTHGTVFGGGVNTFAAPNDGEWVLDLFKTLR